MAAAIVKVLSEEGPATERQLAEKLGKRQPHMHTMCDMLASRGWITRVQSPRSRAALITLVPADERVAVVLLSEDEMKELLRTHLEADGWTVTVMLGTAHGIDIEATRGTERRVIEVKGEAHLGPAQANYAVMALGELVLSMADGDACYVLALPDNVQYRALAARVPAVARERLSLEIWLVNPSGEIGIV